MTFISIQKNLGIPKYKQIIACIEKAIATKQLKKDDRLPSINKVCMAFSLSRDTVLLAYDELKKRGIIYAILGKGYYVKSTEIAMKHRVFLLFDELNIFKEDLYNSILKHLGDSVQVDIFFHHFNPNVFRKLIEDGHGNYTRYIIMPTNLAEAPAIIKTLPADEVFILDQTNSELQAYPAVYQNFVRDMFDALVAAKVKLSQYEKLVLIFPGFREPLGMKEGFIRFCLDFNFKYEIIAEFNGRDILHKEVFIIPNDRDLVSVIEKSKTQNLKLGLDFGVISYNDTPLKKVVENGITTISTRFEKMGEIIAKMLLENRKEQIENPSQLIWRNSL
ncbi:GntR family transcriptional regulator [Flavobacterium sp. CYK-4]|uniref:GntR family transcriptional regulator n=1 Tax=Flavobacterium lotistagni TaxID=2709660 RepID=UPI00140809EA|nr:GntR family transcriptional regulator [Flavobacterium lotistagni]NHM06611.1 GntR family transcriptional regulator [Flavobacterium lotistagni]